jgi:hypothetical protein
MSGRKHKDGGYQRELRDAGNEPLPVLNTPLSLYALFWNGSRGATWVQRVGVALMGCLFLCAGGFLIYSAIKERSVVGVIVASPWFLLGARIVTRLFRPKNRAAKNAGLNR